MILDEAIKTESILLEEMTGNGSSYYPRLDISGMKN